MGSLRAMFRNKKALQTFWLRTQAMPAEPWKGYDGITWSSPKKVSRSQQKVTCEVILGNDTKCAIQITNRDGSMAISYHVENVHQLTKSTSRKKVLNCLSCGMNPPCMTPPPWSWTPLGSCIGGGAYKMSHWEKNTTQIYGENMGRVI